MKNFVNVKVMMPYSSTYAIIGLASTTLPSPISMSVKKASAQLRHIIIMIAASSLEL
ncbi:MAG: hypothetical protein ISR96_02420 [Nitrospira sp.]|nr:hypothetical protein [Nitrospira sp.]